MDLLTLAKMERDKHLFGEQKFIKKYGIKWSAIAEVREILIKKEEKTRRAKWKNY